MRDTQARRRATAPYRQPKEIVRHDGPCICLKAPPVLQTPHEGNILVTPRQYFYFPNDVTPIRLPFDQISEADFTKRGFNSSVVALTLKSGEAWRFDVFPETARAMKRWLARSE